jgi:hypothetical protein
VLLTLTNCLTGPTNRIIQHHHFATKHTNNTAHDNQLIEISVSQNEAVSALIVKTYEKIVLAGSEVRLVCPHAEIPLEAPRPNSLTTLPTRQTALLEPPPPPQQQQQQPLASYSKETKGHTLGPTMPQIVGGGAKSYDGNEQVRWFRNHVPLPNQNYSPNESRVGSAKAGPRSKHQPPSGGGMTTSAAAASGQHQWQDVALQAISSKLNQTAGLMRDEKGNDSSGDGVGSEGNRGLDGSMGHRRKPHTEYTTIHHRTFARTNANELPRNEQFQIHNPQQLAARLDRENIQKNIRVVQYGNTASNENPDWYLGEFGELVHPRIGLGSAGSYTCLHDGKQSEILLDVLSDENSSLASSSADPLTGDPNPSSILMTGEKIEQMLSSRAGSSVESGPAWLESRGELLGSSDGVRVDQPNSRGSIRSSNGLLMSGQVGEGNGKMPPGMGPASLEANVMSSSIGSNTRLRPPLVVDESTALERDLNESPNGQTRANGRRHRRLVVTTTEVPLPDKDLAIQRRSFETPVQFLAKNSQDTINSKALHENNSSTNSELGEQTNSTTNASLEAASENSKRQTNKWTTHLNFITSYRPLSKPQLHLVESEIIPNHDLESIPGLLYTKQQFYCPLINQADLLAAFEDRLNLLIENVCRPQRTDQITDEQYLSCSKLINQLIDQLIDINENCPKSDRSNSGPNGQSSHNSNLYCSNSKKIEKIVDILWYKDGSKLEFDSNGRGIDKRLNVKLIDFINQLEASSNNNDNKASTSPRQAQQIDLSSSREEMSPLLSLAARQQEKSSNRTQQKHVLCPPKGLILEIDGVRRINAGRYTCALRFNNVGLRISLKALKRLRLSHGSQRDSRGEGEGGSGGSGCLVEKNDKSKCCDADNSGKGNGVHPAAAWSVPEMGSAPEIGKTTLSVLRAETLGNGENENIERVSLAGGGGLRSVSDKLNPSDGFLDASTEKLRTKISASSSGRGATDYGANKTESSYKENNEVLADGIEHPFVPKQIMALESILNGSSSISSGEPWTYLEQAISRPQPPVIAQTFFLLITERPGKCCRKTQKTLQTLILRPQASIHYAYDVCLCVYDVHI